MKCRLIRDMTCDACEEFPDGIKPEGTVIDHTDAWRLVRRGVAEPEDAECAIKSCMTPEALERAAYAYERADRGIHPEDFDAYDKGLMDGYNPDGSFIPGPNFAEHQKREQRKNSNLILPEDE